MQRVLAASIRCYDSGHKQRTKTEGTDRKRTLDAVCVRWVPGIAETHGGRLRCPRFRVPVGRGNA